MSIRLKFLIALLVATLLPASFVSLLGLSSMVRLSRTLAADQREYLKVEAEGVMRAVMQKNALTMAQIAGSFASAGMILSAETGRLLEEPAPADAEFFMASAFGEGGAAPGLEHSPIHRVSAGVPGVPPGPALVSYAVPVVSVAPDGDADDARRLAALGETFGALSPSLRQTTFWQFVILDSGVQVVYPGNGLLPDDYDGRQSPIYQRSRPNLDRGVGSSASVDPATGQRLVGSIMPVTDSEGEVIGISGVTARVDTVLEGFRFGTEWGADAETMLVYIDPRVPAAEGIFIIVREAYTKGQEQRAGYLGIDKFEADDPEDTGRIAEGIASLEFGHTTIEIDGEPMLCCFGGMGGNGTGLITLVPVASVSEAADAAAGRIRAQAVNLLIGMLVSAMVFSLSIMMAAVVGVRAITRPIGGLVASIRRVAGGDLDVSAEVESKDEIGELATAFNSMVPQLRDRLRIRHSLDLAQQVQRGLLPVAPPKVPGLDIAARSVYCDETGGDYFDFLEFDRPDSGTLAIAVGDVTGHGVAAALLMATARALVRMRTALPGELAESFGDINRHLATDTDAGRFMTLMFLVLDREKRTARWVGAGHDPVLVYDPQTDSFTELVGRDLPLGIEPGWVFTEEQTDELKPGQVLFVGTDGLWEAFNAAEEPYGKDRLRECIRRHARGGEGSAAEIADSVIEDVERFRGGHPQLDDITLVVIRLSETV